MTRDHLDLAAPVTFLRTAFKPDDWIAVFLKSVKTGRTAHRVQPVTRILEPDYQAWLHAENAAGRSVYVSVNAVAAGQHSRRRETVAAIRHVFLDLDADMDDILTRMGQRPDLPAPSYVVHTSRDRAQVLWRAVEFTTMAVEHVQKHLARELGADRAATSSAQMMRVPGFINHKYVPGHAVSIAYGDTQTPFRPSDFPVHAVVTPATSPDGGSMRRRSHATSVTRARRYLSSIPAAIAGEHGDTWTFRVCCRVVRGFALTDDDAFDVLSEWNARCEPPWTDRELRVKIRNARQYGREPVAGLLEARP